MKSRDVLAVFNRGRIGTKALARVDVGRVSLSADIQTNWMPRTLGPMSLRPGFEYIDTLTEAGLWVPFVKSASETAILDFVPDEMRIYEMGTDVLTRVSVASAVTNGTFDANITSWTESNDAGADCIWVTGGYAGLTGTGIQTARLRQAITVAGGDIAKVHALRIVVQRGPVVLRVGTTAGTDNIFRQAVLRTGTHSIAFTPGADFHIEFSSRLSYQVLVSECSVEAAGPVVLPTPWVDADELASLRYSQVGDIVFVAGAGKQQRRIERRVNGSWSVAEYSSNDGPYAYENVDAISLTASALSGSITLTASQSLFTSSHVGALFALSSQGQIVTGSFSAALSFTDPIRVSGVDAARIFSVARSGTWSGTLSLQRSLTEPGSWATVATYTTNATVNYDDLLDNAIAYYRIGFEAANYTSGTAVVTLAYASGSIEGVVKITAYSSATSVSAIVIKNLGGTAATDVWKEGAWSDQQEWPEAVAFWEGRLWWFGNGRAYGSVSDNLTSFDPNVEGDSGPINRRAGDRAATQINWALPLQRIAVGSVDGEAVIRSSSFDEPVTPANYGVKTPTAKGSANVPAVASGQKGYFVGRDGTSIFELAYSAELYDYSATRTTLLVPEIGATGFTRLAVQQHPDIRLYACRSDGTWAVMVRDEAEDVTCWVDMETDGFVEDVAVLPGDEEDRVFIRVKRTIEDVDMWYIERAALESECNGGAISKLADSSVTGAGAVTGLDHLEGETVVVWADGADVGSFVVASGAVTVTPTPTSWTAGLGYSAQFKSAKLAVQTKLGFTLGQSSRINKISTILADTHALGLQYGPDFDNMDDLPAIDYETETDPDYVWDHYDVGMVEFPGEWNKDNRLCLTAAAPRPCTVLAAVLNVAREDEE